MAIRNAAASAVLGLLFLSLVVIYLLIPQNGLVTFLCILILIVSLIVAQSRRWRDIAVMAAFAAIVSLVAAFLFGRARFGDIGAIVALLVWGGMLLLLFNWTQRNMLAVPKDRAILIRNRYSGATHVAEGPMAPPLMPAVEMRVAEIPLYELLQEVSVKDVNASATHNIDEVKAYVSFRVIDPRAVMKGMPNRAQAQDAVAKDMGLEVREATLRMAFWEKLIDRQLRPEVDGVVRAVFHQNVVAQNALEIYRNRQALADEVREQLNARIKRWGVTADRLEIDWVNVKGEIFKGINKAKVREDMTEERRLEAEREAKWVELVGKAQALVEAERVRHLVTALQETGVDISAEDLRDIVLDAIHASADVNMETALVRPMLEGPAPKPAGSAKDNVAKK